MGGRIALSVLLVLAACKSKSENADKATTGSAPPPVSMPAPGSGSSAPTTPTPVVTTDGVRPADTKVGGDAAVKPDPQPTTGIIATTKPAPPTEPAVPTPAAPSELARQQPQPPVSPKEKASMGTITIESAQTPDSSTLTVDDVTQKIQAAYLPGLQRCYARLLAQEPTASGRIMIGFKVTTTGKLDTVNVTGFAATLVACMKTQVTAWRFPVPTDIRTRYPMLVHFRYGLVLAPS